MPFYMDIHFVGEISVEDTGKAHLAVRRNTGSPTISTGLMRKGDGVMPDGDKEFFCKKRSGMSQCLYLIEEENEIITFRLFEEFCDINEVVKRHISLRAIKPSEQVLLDIIEDKSVHSFFYSKYFL